MRNLVVLFNHFIATMARLLEPGGVRSLVAESLLLKHQLLIVNRSRQRSPNLSASDRILAGWCGWIAASESSRYCSFADSALACFKIGMSGSASFQRTIKSSYAVAAFFLSPDNA